MPETPIDDSWLATLSIGLPVGLGVYYAWLHRGWPARIKAMGLAAALVSGLVGAWLGFHSAPDLLALFTAIAGSIAGANLALVVLDLSKPRREEQPAAPERAAVPTPV